MKLALPTRNNEVDNHFGHCEYFTVYEINDAKEIIAEEKVEAPSGCGCKSNIATVLAERGVSVMLAGNMGQGAVNVLNQNKIEVVRGCSGNIKEVAEAYLRGEVVDSSVGCTSHDCGHH
ncbi:Predicted Fe-Mo cluster-binding protein, NifX family [Desulfonispora thiosulfatigenes DSM 11270]|uniref:Predicted Fe-Mo cluster-binding protein, NifX family n=1 Tax=Desulfonispora thiosulfatigenes DSM 11270 TaxID=656914 RepID=A0A1W1ULU4_DESTI|nr:NifB/NifX family molybdenum-iron cluster-binding protein [Desulfonispora thiosulfatigenes]SMB81694.1 Predicted Fe-Mo cluster-binding protein, NifX family [Desulfonispora thiosulfatigenes DSM 11270]